MREKFVPDASGKKYKTIFVLTGLVKAAENGHEHFKSGSFWWGFISISLFIYPNEVDSPL